VIAVEIWTDGSQQFEVSSMSPSEIKEFVDLIKTFGVWIDSSSYQFKEAVYHAENEVFEIIVE
jgi:hypothetical protein